MHWFWLDRERSAVEPGHSEATREIDMNVEEILVEFPESVADPDSQAYWDAAGRGELSIQRCVVCARGTFPPRAGACWHCGGRLEWTTASRTGTAYTWVGVDAVIHSWQAELVPYTVLVVELDALPGCRLECLYLDDREDLAIGARCEIEFKYPGRSGVPRPVASRL
jgi:uncharacterized OB-fold protein